MSLNAKEQAALAALDVPALIAAFRDLLRISSVTGHEVVAQHWLAGHMQEAGLEVDLWPISIAEVQQHPDFPGMEVDRSLSDSLGLVGKWSVPGKKATGKTLIFNGHIDVVPEGDRGNWSHDPWGAELEQGCIYGRGSCDMKGGLIAALYAIKAIKDAALPIDGTLLLQSVIGEEDGGIGTFSTLLRGHTGDAAIICEPTRLHLIPAQAGALTFTGRILGRSAHACVRLEGVSAIEKYLVVHRALLQFERERNNHVEHPLLGKLPLPYALSIGRVQAGNWSSSVPEELTFQGRLGVAMGESMAAARQQFEQTLSRLGESDPWLHEHPVEVEWDGGQFAPGEIAVDHSLVQLCGQCIHELIGRVPEIEGAPYGSDLRLLVNFGKIPSLLFGPGDVRVAHMPDEHIQVEELLLAARLYILAALRYLQ